MLFNLSGIDAPLLPLYLDPGTGSFLIQLLAGVLVGGLLAVKIYWRKLLSFFRKDKPVTDATEVAGDENISDTLK